MHAMTEKNATWREMCKAYLVTKIDEDDGDETAAQDRWWLVLGMMKTINAGSFFLLVFLCFFEMMKPMCSPPLRLFLPFSFCFSLLYSPLSFSLLSSFLPSLSRLYFSCVTLCSALLSSFSHGSSLLFFCVFSFPFCLLSLSFPPLFFLFVYLSPLLSISPPVFPHCHLSSLVSFLHPPSLVQYILWLL